MNKEEFKLNPTLVVLAFLYIAGAIVSYLTLDVHIKTKTGIDESLAICNINSELNCKAVTQSEYSELFNIPLGVYGIFFYSSLLFLLLQHKLTSFWTKSQIFTIFTLSHFVSLGFSLYLFYVSKFIIQTLCPLCLILYAISIVCFLMSILTFKKLNHGNFFKGTLNSVKEIIFYAHKPNIRVFSQLLLAVTGVGLIAAWSVFLPKYMQNDAHAIVNAWPSKERINIELRPDDSIWGDYYYGDKEAPIQIVKFADFECPFCRKLGKEMKTWLEPFEGKYYLVFLNYPLDNNCNPSIPHKFHDQACYMANLTRCAGEQNKFWETYDLLNEMKDEDFQGNQIIVREKINLMTSHLDNIALQECIKSKRQIETIKKDITRGDALGIQGTPSVFINGQIIETKTLSKKKIQNIVNKLLE